VVYHLKLLSENKGSAAARCSAVASVHQIFCPVEQAQEFLFAAGHAVERVAIIPLTVTAAVLLAWALAPQALVADTLMVPAAYVFAVAPVIVMDVPVELPVKPLGNVQV
jgi:hypothetical protein